MALLKSNKRQGQAVEAVETCPHCGAPLKGRKAPKPKRWHERTSVTLGVAGVLVVIAFGFIHVITGVESTYELPFDIVRKESFGYRETFVDARAIEALPYTAARIKYPLGCQALQRKGYLPSGHRFEARTVGKQRGSIQRWQARFESALGRPQRHWEDRLQSRAAGAQAGPEEARACNQRGIVLAKEGQYQAALAQFSRAIRKAPTFAEALHNRALIYVAIGNFGQGAADLGRVVEIRPQFIEGYVEQGRLYLAMSQYDQAVAACTRAIEVDPQCAEAYFERALASYAKGEYRGAWKDVQKINSLGAPVPSDFLSALQEASGGGRPR